MIVSSLTHHSSIWLIQLVHILFSFKTLKKVPRGEKKHCQEADDDQWLKQTPV